MLLRNTELGYSTMFDHRFWSLCKAILSEIPGFTPHEKHFSISP